MEVFDFLFSIIDICVFLFLPRVMLRAYGGMGECTYHAPPQQSVPTSTDAPAMRFHQQRGTPVSLRARTIYNAHTSSTTNSSTHATCSTTNKTFTQVHRGNKNAQIPPLSEIPDNAKPCSVPFNRNCPGQCDRNPVITRKDAGRRSKTISSTVRNRITAPVINRQHNYPAKLESFSETDTIFTLASRCDVSDSRSATNYE